MKISTNTKYLSKNIISSYLINIFHKNIINILKNDINETDKIIDIGSGEGVIYSSISSEKMFLLDIDVNELRCARENVPNAKVIVGDICNLPYKERVSNIVTCFEVLEHVPNYKRALKEIFRISNKYCIISIPNEPLWRILNIMRGAYWENLGNTPGHINHWNKKQIINTIKQSKNVRIKKIYTPIPWILLLIEVINKSPD